MLKRKGTPVSFDAMVKLFMQNYGIPTRRDVEKLIERLDRLEKLATTAISTTAVLPRSSRSSQTSAAASKMVLDAIKKSKTGLKFADIQAKTGYPEKKIRNIIFRLNKLSKIKRHTWGVYIVA